MKVIVLDVENIEYTNKVSGRPVKFCKVTYTDGQFRDDGQHIGLEVVTVPGEHSLLRSVEVLPGLYELEIGAKTGWQGVIEAKAARMRFLGAINLVPDAPANGNGHAAGIADSDLAKTKPA